MVNAVVLAAIRAGCVVPYSAIQGRASQGRLNQVRANQVRSTKVRERHHTSEETIATRELCSRVQDGGYQCDQQFLLWLWAQK